MVNTSQHSHKHSHTGGWGFHTRCHLLIWSQNHSSALTQIGISILPKDTCKLQGLGIKPLTLWLVDNCSTLLSHSHMTTAESVHLVMNADYTPSHWRQKPDVTGCWWVFSFTVKRLWNVRLYVNTVEVLRAIKKTSPSRNCPWDGSKNRRSCSTVFISKLTQNNLHFPLLTQIPVHFKIFLLMTAATGVSWLNEGNWWWQHWTS